MKSRNRSIMMVVTTILLTVFLVAPTGVLAAEATVNLGTASSFAVLAGTTITNTGPTVISGSVGGDIGVSPGTAITGFPPGTLVVGEQHSADSVAEQAQLDLKTAYDDAAGRPSTMALTGQDLGGKTLTTGVYTFTSSAQLTGTLILDAQNDPEAAFIFQIGSTLKTAPSSKIILINGARFCRVFWQVGSSATLGTSTDFIGHIFALTSITANTDATVVGQLLALNGAVTLDSNTITNGDCDVLPTPTVTPTATPTPTTGATTDEETTATDATETSDTEETTLDVTTDETTADNEDVPKTGESDNYLVVAAVLIGLAGSLALINYRRKHMKR